MQQEELQILISTDVLSEGQNLQDAQVCINYDLHWNPVRMIQRAGRIDRLGALHPVIKIYNFFPEQGLEELLRLVERLQRRIADIGRTVGLDSSVLGEAISIRSLEELRRLKARDRQLLEELEQASELLSIDEMRLPLLAYLQELGKTQIEQIPLGIHSGKRAEIEGVFFSFRAKDRHFWRFYPADGGGAVTDKRRLFRWIRCNKETDRVLPSDFRIEGIFPLLERATEEILDELRAQEVRRKIHEPLKGMNLKLYNALNQEDIAQEVPEELRQRLNQVLEKISLKPFERDPILKGIWRNYQETLDPSVLAETLDQFFVESELYRDVSQPILERIKGEDLRLVGYLILT